MKRKAGSLPALTPEQHAQLQKLLRFKSVGEEGAELAAEGAQAPKLRAAVEARVRLRSPFAWVEAEDPAAPLQWLDGIAGPAAACLRLGAAPELSPDVRRHLELATVPNLRACLEAVVLRQLGRGHSGLALQEAELIMAAETSLLECVADAAQRAALRLRCKPLWEEALKGLWHFFHEGRPHVATRYRGRHDAALDAFLKRADFFRVPAIELSGTEEQRDVARQMLDQLRARGWSVLSGCGGAGKTFILGQLAGALKGGWVGNEFRSALTCPLCDESFVGVGCGCGFRRPPGAQRPIRILFAAPTNRAVAVLRQALAGAAGPPPRAAEEAEELQCCTLHALSCARHEAPVDLLVVDESSMLAAEHGDIIVGCAALRRSALLLVGDELQLPPVGTGELFRPLLRLAALPSLVRNLRAAGPLQQPIAAIRRGQASEASAFATTARDEAERRRAVYEAVEAAAAGGGGSVQVLALRHEDRLEYCRFAIRRHHEAADDDYASGKPRPFAFRPFVGEPVRFQNNKLKPHACRGSLGVVAAVAEEQQAAPGADGRPRLVYRIDVRLPGGGGGGQLVQVKSSHAALGFELRPAFAITVHDSQGGEFDEVHVLLPPSPSSPLCTLEMLYTAASRARRSLRLWCVAGAFEAFEEQLARTSPLRATPLKTLLFAGRRG